MGRRASGKYVYKPGDHKHLYTWRECAYCGAEYLGRVDNNSRFCSLRCSGKATGKQPRPAASRDGYLICMKCGEEKPEAEFSRHSQSATGRKPRCKECHAAYWLESRTPEILERMRANDKRRWLADPERMRARARESTAKYREANRELVREQARERYRANPEKRKNTEHRRRAQKRRAPVFFFFSEALLTSKWVYWAGRCWICGGEATTWDHVKPLAKGGSHCLANLRPACRSCNCRKRDKWPYSPQRQAA